VKHFERNPIPLHSPAGKGGGRRQQWNRASVSYHLNARHAQVCSSVRPISPARTEVPEVDGASLRIPVRPETPARPRRSGAAIVIWRWGTSQHPESEHGSDQVVRDLSHVGIGAKLATFSRVDACPAEERTQFRGESSKRFAPQTEYAETPRRPY